MELNYFRKTESYLDAARRAAAVLIGGMESIRNIAWIDKDYKLCARVNNIIESALKEAGPEWSLYDRAESECNDYNHRLQSINNGHKK